MLKAIWAMDRNNLIGKDNKLAWHYKEDLIFFKTMTKGKDVLMGYNTYKSLKYYYKDKPFPFGMVNVVTSRDIKLPNCNIIRDLDAFINMRSKDTDLFVIGGKMLYESLIGKCDVLYVTVINEDHEGDTYLNVDLDKFKLMEIRKSGVLDFRVYEK